MTRSLALVLVLLAAGAPLRAQEDDPKSDAPSSSSITEYPPPPAPKPKPKPAPPAPANPKKTPPPPATPKATTAVKPTAPASAPPAAKPPAANAAPAPGGSSMQEVEVPKGQSLDSVKVAGAIDDKRPGIGELIVEIKIVDNTKTTANTVEYIAGVKLHEVLTPELIESARTNLNNVGLFKEVNIFWESAPGGVRLVISARDKLSWIIAPLFAYSATEIGGGLAYLESNAFGKNKKFLALGEYTTAEKLLFVAWLDPQIRNSPFYYRVDLLLRRDHISEYATGHDGAPRLERGTDVDTVGGEGMIGVNFTRHFHFDLRLKLYYDNVNPSECYNTTNRDGSGTPDVVAWQGGYCRQPSSSGWDNTLNFGFGYNGQSDVYGVLHGLKVDVGYQYGATWLGTRWNYHLLSAAGVYAWRFFKEHNLILHLGADVFFDPPFKLEVETGGAEMRGFVYRQYRGDTDVRATLEYLLPLFTVYGLSVRAIGFYDTNLTWFRGLPQQSSPLARFVVRGDGFRDYLPDTPSGLVRDSWHNGIGLGLRMYLKGVVLPLIGVDVAYGFESQAFQVYLALGSTLN